MSAQSHIKRASTTCCVQCGARSKDPLYKEYGQRSDSGNIRLTRCSSCDSRLDKYLEYDPVLITIDLILHKVEVYRHLLFNSSTFLPHAHRVRSNVSLVFVILVCFDAFLKWHTAGVTGQDTSNTLLHVCSTVDPGAGAGAGAGDGGSIDPATMQPTTHTIAANLLTTSDVPTTTSSPSTLSRECFNTSAEDAIIERFVDGIYNTDVWTRSIVMFSLALAENLLYIVAIVLAIRMWESICPLNTSSASSGASSSVGSSSSDATTLGTREKKNNSESSRSAANRGLDPTLTRSSHKLKQKSTERVRVVRSDSLDGGGGASVSTTMIVCAVILSSWGKFLLLLLMVWDYSNDMIHVINFVVVASNFTAVHALLSVGHWPPRAVSLVLVLLPFCLRTLFQMVLSHTFGMAVVYSTKWTPW